MAKELCMSHEPGQQDTSPPSLGGESPQVHACLPWFGVQERAAPDWVSTFTAVPVPWSPLSGVIPLCCLPTWFSAESRHLNAGAAPTCPMASCVYCADCNGQEPDGRLCPATRILIEELPLWAPGSRANCKLYLVFPRVGTYKRGARKEQEMRGEHNIGEMLSLLLCSR